MSVVKTLFIKKHECYCHCNVAIVLTHSLSLIVSLPTHIFMALSSLSLHRRLKILTYSVEKRGKNEDERLQRTIHFYSFLSQALTRLVLVGIFGYWLLYILVVWFVINVLFFHTKINEFQQVLNLNFFLKIHSKFFTKEQMSMNLQACN